MHIGKVSELTGATRKAIRHYEAISLIPIPNRMGKYRVYTEQDVMLISMIRHAQSVGFTLIELKELVAHKAKYNKFPLDIANGLIQQKRKALHHEINRIIKQDESLQALHEELNRAFQQPPPAFDCANGNISS
jgi:DNA-binding transcriptional MerR regulator